MHNGIMIKINPWGNMNIELQVLQQSDFVNKQKNPKKVHPMGSRNVLRCFHDRGVLIKNLS